MSPMTQANLRRAIATGHSLRRSGRMREAEGLYRQVLRAAPDDPEVLHGLGLVLGVTGR